MPTRPRGDIALTGVDVAGLVDLVDERLRAAGNPERAEGSRRYLHSDLEFYGASVPALRSVVVAVWREHPLGGPALRSVATGLWERPVFECRLAAVELLVAGQSELEGADLGLVESMVRTSQTWALVDRLATGVAAPLVERFEQSGEILDAWAADADFWVRRTALLALLPELRAGRGDFERFCRYADAMLDEKEFFIRKAIGWVLRETGRKRPAEVRDWLAPRTARASGVTMREAVKHLPPADADRLMAAYRRGEPAA